MPYRIRSLDEAVRRSRRDVIELGEELANARRKCGATQAEVARAIGWSGSKVRRIERGQRASVTHQELACFASVVGLSYSGRLFVGTTRLRDATQLRTITSYRSFASRCGWSCRIEEPVPITGDLRAFDLMLRAGSARVAHEFVSRLRDAQAQVRPLLLKQRDAGVGSLILVLRDTAENRRAVAEARDVLADHFPIGSRAALAAIRECRDPGGNAIVFWRADAADRIVGAIAVEAGEAVDAAGRR
ncbi:MAG: helix-turn-helix domain-containing protein [Candidatus Limnocylindria bacterium]